MANLFTVSASMGLVGESLSLSAFDDFSSAEPASGAGRWRDLLQFRFETFSDAVREKGVGQLGVCHHLEQVVIGQPVRQVLVETFGYPQHVHRMYARKFRAAEQRDGTR